MDSNSLHLAVDTEENCKHISAEELQISWGDNPSYWEMVPDPNSIMFPKNIARLKNVCWFDVKGEIVCSLPPGAFTVSWRACLSAHSRGWDSEPVHFTFSKNETEVVSECKCYIDRTRSGVLRSPTQMEQFSLPTIRAVEKGWIEYDIGEFVVEEGEENCALRFAMLATDNRYWKSGLSLDGVFIRPKGLMDPVPAVKLESKIEGCDAGPSDSMIVQLESNKEVFDAGPSISATAANTREHSGSMMTNAGSGRSSLGFGSGPQIGASLQAVSENINAHIGWRVPIKLIDVKMSLESYHGEMLEIHTESFPRDLDKYYIISYVWSLEDGFAVDEICGLTRTRRTITSCSLASFVAMLDICDQMGMKHVWIDCVCVEQEIKEVKSLQLAEMGYYYSRATRCLVFLNGLNMYIPPIFEGSNIGAWYDRVWTVQEGAYTFSKKTFVHALPPARTVLESSDTITFLRCRSEHFDLISRCLTHNIYRGSNDELSKAEDIPPVSKWLLGLVCEEKYSAFLSLLPHLSKEVHFCWSHWQTGAHLREKTIRSLDLKSNNVSQIIREALRGTRGCRYPQDRVYSIMTLLGIELDVSYSRSLRDTICKAAETMSPEMLVHFVTATWYSQNGHVLPEVTENTGTASLVVMGISNCITDVKVEGLDLLITTKTKSASISRLGDNFYSSQAVGMGWYPTRGHAFLVNGNVKARGEVDLGGSLLYPGRPTVAPWRYGSDAVEAKILFMGKSLMKEFEIDSNGLMKGSLGDDVPANVCLVVRREDPVWIKIGVLYVSEDLVFELEPDKLVLKL